MPKLEPTPRLKNVIYSHSACLVFVSAAAVSVNVNTLATVFPAVSLQRRNIGKSTCVDSLSSCSTSTTSILVDPRLVGDSETPPTCVSRYPDACPGTCRTANYDLWIAAFHRFMRVYRKRPFGCQPVVVSFATFYFCNSPTHANEQ